MQEQKNNNVQPILFEICGFILSLSTFSLEVYLVLKWIKLLVFSPNINCFEQ